MLYKKKATVASNVFTNGTSSIPTRPIGASTVPTKVGALIAKWSTPVPPTKVTTAADGTIRIPAAAFSTGQTTAKVAVMHSASEDGSQLTNYGGNVRAPQPRIVITLDSWY